MHHSCAGAKKRLKYAVPRSAGRRDLVESLLGEEISLKGTRRKGLATNAIEMMHRNLRERILAFEHYGGLKCACCGEDEFSFLSLDHIDEGAGNTERLELFGKKYQGGHHFYRKLRLKNYPAGYQVLCMNCQVGRRDNVGVCPHQKKPLNGQELLGEFDKLRVGRGSSEGTESKEYKSALANIMRRAKPKSPIRAKATSA